MTNTISAAMQQQTYSVDSGTATPSFTLPTIDMPTRISALEHTERTGNLVTKVTRLNNDVRETHVEALTHEWRVLTSQRAVGRVQDLLQVLADQGFAWRDIARMLGVSVPAIQKWRKGEKASGENRHRIASLVAAQDLIASKGRIQEIESWFEMPVTEGIPVTPIDLWASGETFLVLEYASGHLDPEEALTRFDPSWRTTYESPFETFRGEDGQMSIRSKG
ncbi:helix-turn-helix domain-containing protein [Arthrobacter sp. ISL-65]|uniref:helix-turn-helix domain-containing protein n=1 Tax=Arthrobacter sp. ISL-65 TaxID=2819112 RepID=UPI001BE7F55D|nr:hypothetical protein [Arthrobacter sp. ISL-65]MBT2551265.1 hypothetical protein [Arthrobacter sp. ISL-65]